MQATLKGQQMVSPPAELPVRAFLHSLERLRLSAKKGQSSTRPPLGLPGRSEGRVVAKFSTGSTKLQPPGLTLQMVGPGLAASPTQQVGGNQPNCLAEKSRKGVKVLGSQWTHRQPSVKSRPAPPGNCRYTRPIPKAKGSTLPVLAEVRVVGWEAVLQLRVCRTHWVGPSQAGGYLQVS
eukprot:2016579-Amphidinium_carterae.1